MLKPRTITKETPVTAEEVRKFADSINVGDQIIARLPVIRIWTSTSNYTLKHRTVRATIITKYPHQVRTDYGVFTWKELIFGYYDGGDLCDEDLGDGADTGDTIKKIASKTKKGRTSKKAA